MCLVFAASRLHPRLIKAEGSEFESPQDTVPFSPILHSRPTTTDSPPLVSKQVIWSPLYIAPINLLHLSPVHLVFALLVTTCSSELFLQLVVLHILPFVLHISLFLSQDDTTFSRNGRLSLHCSLSGHSFFDLKARWQLFPNHYSQPPNSSRGQFNKPLRVVLVPKWPYSWFSPAMSYPVANMLAPQPNLDRLHFQQCPVVRLDEDARRYRVRSFRRSRMRCHPSSRPDPYDLVWRQRLRPRSRSAKARSRHVCHRCCLQISDIPQNFSSAALRRRQGGRGAVVPSPQWRDRSTRLDYTYFYPFPHPCPIYFASLIRLWALSMQLPVVKHQFLWFFPLLRWHRLIPHFHHLWIS